MTLKANKIAAVPLRCKGRRSPWSRGVVRLDEPTHLVSHAPGAAPQGEPVESPRSSPCSPARSPPPRAPRVSGFTWAAAAPAVHRITDRGVAPRYASEVRGSGGLPPVTANIVLVEENAAVAEAVTRELRKLGSHVTLRLVASREELASALRGPEPDVVITAHWLSAIDGHEALLTVRGAAPDVPVIVVAPSLDEQEVVAYTREGAADCIVAEHLVRLSGAVQGAIHSRRHREEIRRAEAARLESEVRYQEIFNEAPLGIYQSTPDGRLLAANPAIARMLGYDSPEELLQRNLAEDVYWDHHDREALIARYATAGRAVGVSMLWKRRDGTPIWVELNFQPILDAQGEVVRFEGFVQDVTERRRAEEARERLAAILEATTDFVGTADAEARTLYLNRAGRRMLGIGEREDLTGRPIAMYHPPWAFEVILTDALPAAAQRGVWSGETALLHRDGTEIPVSQVVLSHRAPDGRIEYYSMVMRDLRERKRLEGQLLQSQKMEAVGRLAGGVAHDFNNIITAIVGYTDLLLEELPLDDSRREDIEEIRKIAERAAALTQQLLAFSRKQVLQPVVLDLNTVVANMDKMLRRLIGEDVDLLTVSGEELGLVRADPGQIEQVIVNLAVNARDAMPRGGRLTIETTNAELDTQYVREHVGASTGAYVMLAVSDTGVGIDASAKARMFEPFFTTKGPDKGTGLGLSTVYGIVKQSEGHIWVYSEPGQGTTFKIYLPRVAAGVAAQPLPIDAMGEAHGTETILLVEDAVPVRRLTRKVLEQFGYTVLEAEGPEQAIDICRAHAEVIDLVLTDVVMPGMSGRELAARLNELRPGVKVVYMSGYTDDAVIHHGVLAQAVAYVQKPFTPAALARKVRATLDG